MKISVLSYSLLTLGVITTSSLVWSVVIVRISGLSVDKTRIPRFIQCCAAKTIYSDKIAPEHDHEINVNKEADGDVIDKEEIKEQPLTWLQVANFLDGFFFAAMCCNTLITCCV